MQRHVESEEEMAYCEGMPPALLVVIRRTFASVGDTGVCVQGVSAGCVRTQSTGAQLLVSLRLLPSTTCIDPPPHHYEEKWAVCRPWSHSPLSCFAISLSRGGRRRRRFFCQDRSHSARKARQHSLCAQSSDSSTAVTRPFLLHPPPPPPPLVSLPAALSRFSLFVPCLVLCVDLFPLGFAAGESERGIALARLSVEARVRATIIPPPPTHTHTVTHTQHPSAYSAKRIRRRTRENLPELFAYLFSIFRCRAIAVAPPARTTRLLRIVRTTPRRRWSGG